MARGSVSIPNSIVQKAKDMLKTRVIRYFKTVGEECVNEAVESGNYQDHTGNLRSSIGYVVADDGRVVEEGGFWQIGYGDEGQSKGRAKAYDLAQNSTGIALILVAGMDYAAYVADQGYNVIESAEILARRLTDELRH